MNDLDFLELSLENLDVTRDELRRRHDTHDRRREEKERQDREWARLLGRGR